MNSACGTKFMPPIVAMEASIRPSHPISVHLWVCLFITDCWKVAVAPDWLLSSERRSVLVVRAWLHRARHGYVTALL